MGGVRVRRRLGGRRGRFDVVMWNDIQERRGREVRGRLMRAFMVIDLVYIDRK
jgi:hypothetical protein